MSKEPLFRTGIVSCDGKDFVFYLRDFQFCIIDPSKESIGILPNGNPPRLSANADGLICGTTHNNKDVAIYAKLPCPICQKTRRLNSSKNLWTK